MQDSFIQNPSAEIDCQEVDVQQIEQAGIDIVNQVNDFVMNVDVTNLQFDVAKLYENAQKIGLDAGDLSEYGFEKGSKCGGQVCFNENKIRSIKDILELNQKISD